MLQSQTGSDPAGHPRRVPNQTDSDSAAWGTQPAAAGSVSEAAGVKASFSLKQASLTDPAVGIHDLPDGDLATHYTLGGGGKKTVTFGESSIRVAVRRPGEFSEILPLLVPADGRLVPVSGGVTLKTPRGNFQVSFGPGATATIAAPSASVLKKRVVVLTLHARDELNYTLESGK